MKIANDVPFGLSASIQTTNVSRVFDFVYRMEAGLLTVNLPSAGVEYQLPFGGTKDSSFGPKEQGPAALIECSREEWFSASNGIRRVDNYHVEFCVHSCYIFDPVADYEGDPSVLECAIRHLGKVSL